MAESLKTEVVIVGAGLTGLTMALYLKKAGIVFKIIDKSAKTGGVIQTISEKGFVYETGPNTGVVSCHEMTELFEEFAPTLTRAGSEFVFHGISFRLNLQGLHNAENAYYALHLAKKLGCDLEIVRDALEKFKGIQRRLEFIGEVGDIKVIDDYAHNPAKISASWKALASTADRLIAIWRPHGYGPLRSMLDDLVEQLPAVVRKSDLLYILPVYDVGGTANRSINSDILAERLAKTGMNVNFVKHMDYLKRDIINSAKPGDTIVTMGARDPQLPVMAREILEALPSNSK